MLSGVLIGLGVVINTQTSNPYIGAMLFSIALLVIIECNLKLYTGKIAYIKEITTKTLSIILFGNLIGVIIPALISMNKDGFYEQLINVSNIKFSNGYIELFLYGAMCGVLIFLAVYCKQSKIITIFCIMVFILSGYEHCIADFPYLIINFNIQNLLKFLCVIAGNSIGSICTRKLIN